MPALYRTSPKNLHLKIQLSSPKNGQRETLIAHEWTLIIQACGFSIVSKDFQIRNAIKAFYEEDIVETVVSVKLENAYGVDLSALSIMADKLVTKWCQNTGHGLHGQHQLEILSPSAYFSGCTQIHRLCLNNFSLGNFLNVGTFIDHFRISRYQVNGDKNNQIKLIGEINAIFEHDLCRFKVNFTLNEFNTSIKRYIRKSYNMNLDYKSIHSVVVDYSENENNSAALYLNLKCVPNSFIYVPKDSNNPSQGKYMEKFFPYTSDFSRVSEASNLGNCISKCSALKLVFPANVNDKVEREELWNILSRLKYRAKVHIYFLAVRTHRGHENEIKIRRDLFDSFSCYYLIRALWSRGYKVQDQLDERFIRITTLASNSNEKVAEKALEILLCAIDEHRYITLRNAFIKIFKFEYSTNSVGLDTQLLYDEDNEIEVPMNCIRIRKLIVTPSRELLMPPEVIMGNRVLREFGHEFALRVLFREEDGQKIHAGRLNDDPFNNIRDILINGYQCGDRHYKFLAWSNSQLRDHGCYMFCQTDNGANIDDIRRWMGDFTASKNVPKYMSRMGQCFTQALEVAEIPTNNSFVKFENDIIGCIIEPLNNSEPYIFSDGIGRISEAFVKWISAKLKLNQKTPPSAYQIRYSGCKGMLTLDPRLDKIYRGPQLILRPSMKKFESDHSSHVLEIVKHSQPSAVYLNRPLIMILDQVSFKQHCHTKVTNAIHKLLENELFTMTDMLLSEEASVQSLINRTSLNIKFSAMRSSGFCFTSEPFFRGLLLAIHSYTLKSRLLKMKIEIPLNRGRTMYGVLDETGTLQSEQVFIQYSTDKNKPGENIESVTGKVMVTKNPCHCPGDVRILTAVYKNALKHLYDVIVFPSKGPRPHTDEMAGSDLDGDEYAVFWATESDDNLDIMFNHSEKASHFPKAKVRDIYGGVKDQDMVDFFLQYIRQDSIGSVCIAHLVCADQFSLFHPKCVELAKKCSIAVDFPKTGIPADDLTKEERSQKHPDYLQSEHKPTYRSKRLLGQLFSKVNVVLETVEASRYDIGITNSFDLDLKYPGWEIYRERAIEARDRFFHHLQSLMDLYGIQDEFQLISGHMVSIRNRVNDGEKGNFSVQPFNTEKFVEMRVHKIFDKFRRDFFDDFGGECPEFVEMPNERMKKKASAYYMVTYSRDNNSAGVSILSFPWLVWDILAYIKRHRVFGRGADVCMIEPVQERLAVAIQNYCELPTVIAKQFKIIRMACTKYPDLKFPLLVYGSNLTDVLFVLLRWCEKEGVYERSALSTEHVAALFIHFASGNVIGWQSSDFDGFEYIQKMEFLKQATENKKELFSGSLTLKRPGTVVLEFIKYLSSQQFLCQNELDFSKFSSLQTKFSDREWVYLNSIAFKSYHHIAWTSNFKSLYIVDHTVEEQPLEFTWDRNELNPVRVQFMINGPLCLNEANLDRYSNLLAQWSGMDCVQMREEKRRMPNKCKQMLVVGIGSLEARNKLKELLFSEELEDALAEGCCPQSLNDD